MMHEDWIKYDEWVADFVKQKLKNKNDAGTLLYFKKTIGDIYNNKAVQLINKGDRAKSLEYTIKSIKIYEEVGDRWRLSSGYNNVGSYYQEINDFETALKYYTKGLKIAEEAKDKDNISIGLLSLGSLYEEKGDYVSALEYYKKSFEMAKQFGDITRYPQCLNYIGNIYKLNGDDEQALVYYYESLEITKTTGSVEEISNSYGILGEFHLERNNIDEAYKAALKSFELAQQLGYPSSLLNSSGLLSAIHEKQGQWMDALKMYELHIKMSDSLTREEDNQKTIKIQAKFEYEKQKAIDDAEHDKQLAIEQEEKEKQQILTFATAGGLGLVVVFLIFVFNRLQVTKKQKVVIEEQKQEVEQQKEVVEMAHAELEEKNQEIMDSITYAKRIQSAILPPDKVVKEYLENSFILYKPKDIVAGDFYWMETINSNEGRVMGNEKEDTTPIPHNSNLILFAAADCTGHGVPGAMVSVVCNNALNRSVREHGLTNPGEILTKIREIVIQEFEKSEEEVKDGMDIALCSLEYPSLKTHRSTPILKYAGAHNPLWIIRPSVIASEERTKQSSQSKDSPFEGNTRDVSENVGDDLSKYTSLKTQHATLYEVKADKQPIGQFRIAEPFTTHTLELQPGDTIYIFSDGYVDQFGGEKGKKFKAKAFRELLLSIQDQTMEEQRKIINNTFEAWRGNLEQLDDVCVIGVKI